MSAGDGFLDDSVFDIYSIYIKKIYFFFFIFLSISLFCFVLFLKLLESPHCQNCVYYKLSSTSLIKQIVQYISLAQFLKFESMECNYKIFTDLYYICTSYFIIFYYCHKIL